MATEMRTPYRTIHKVDAIFPTTAAKGPAFEFGSIVEMQDLWNSAHNELQHISCAPDGRVDRM